eukprot:402022-Amphidinium_carterae.1
MTATRSRRRVLREFISRSETMRTAQDPTKTGDLLVDYCVEVLDYRLSVSWWISRLVVSQTEVEGKLQDQFLSVFLRLVDLVFGMKAFCRAMKRPWQGGDHERNIGGGAGGGNGGMGRVAGQKPG